MKRLLTLVKVGSTLYPHKEVDTVLLEECGAPIIEINVDYFPVLTELCARLKTKVQVNLFEDLEAEMLNKIRERWEHALDMQKNTLVFSYPKTVTNASVDKMLTAIRVWYEKHHVKTEIVVKRRSRITIVFVYKTLNV